MEMTPRYAFYGYAAAIGGRIYRPEPGFDLDPGCASALTPSGGISRAEIKGRRFGTEEAVVSFDGAVTLASGEFADREKAIAHTNHELSECELETRTTSRAEVKGIQVQSRGFPGLRIGRLVAGLQSWSPDSSREPSMQVSDEIVIEDVFIDDFALRVNLNKRLFQEHDTHDKLMAACADGRYVEEQGASLRAAEFVAEEEITDNSGVTRRRRCPPPPRARHYKYTTVVRELTWAGADPSYARIEGHTIVVRDFGRIFFGEFLVGAAARRLTMVRLELGSPMGGDVSASAVGQNGGWAP
ncbi:MAG: hypothetical protein ACRD1U_05210 [Vicinamibacterales bacterium]